MAKLVIGITGKRYSGKSEVAVWLSKNGFKILDFTADVLGPELRRQGKKVERQNLIKLATNLRAKYGTDILAKRLAEKSSGEKIVISGIRFPEEVNYFRKKFGKSFRLVAVTSNSKTRWRRASKVSKGEGNLSFKDFMKVEKAATEKNIPKLIGMSDCRISNNRNKKDLYRKISRFASL